MLRTVPVMIYHCIADALKVLLIDVSSRWLVDNGNVSSYKTFSVMEYIELIVVKSIVVKFLHDKGEIPYHELFRHLRQVGEDIL